MIPQELFDERGDVDVELHEAFRDLMELASRNMSILRENKAEDAAAAAAAEEVVEVEGNDEIGPEDFADAVEFQSV